MTKTQKTLPIVALVVSLAILGMMTYGYFFPPKVQKLDANGDPVVDSNGDPVYV